jgi:hypothetical protein
MNESLPLFPCSFWPIIFWFVHISLTPPEGSNHSVVWQLRLYTHPRWLPHQCQTYTRCSTIIICCGCAYEWVLTMLQLLSSATSFGTHLPRIMDTSLGAKHSAVMCWWGYRPIQDDPHTNVKHMKVVSECQVAVDVHMDESLPCYYPCSCWPSVWRFSWNLVPSHGFDHSVMSWLRL